MEVRGSVLKSIDEFVSNNHSGSYSKWKDSLTNETRGYLQNIGVQKWYPLKDGVVDPTEKMCKLCYRDPNKGAWECGRYSAEMGLTGIYKIFVLVSSPAFLLKRSSRVMTTFYAPTKIEIVKNTDTSVLLHIIELPDNNELLEHRIGGWMEKALELCGCKGISINIINALSKGDAYTAYDINWK